MRTKTYQPWMQKRTIYIKENNDWSENQNCEKNCYFCFLDMCLNKKKK